MLEAALHDLETVWTTQSARIVEYLAEGSSPERTRQQAVAFGLDLADDLVTWFAWHDAFALSELGVKNAFPGLLELTRDRIPVVRESAATVLGKIGAPVDIGPLVALLDDSYPGVAQMAAWALGEISDPAAIEPLEEATRAADGTLARIAKEALSSLKLKE